MAKVAHIVGDSASLIILRDLAGGPKRFGDFTTSLCGISTRTIAKKLKDLEKFDLITRTVLPGKLLCVEYALTEKGKGFEPVEKAMREYGERYL